MCAVVCDSWGWGGGGMGGGGGGYQCGGINTTGVYAEVATNEAIHIVLCRFSEILKVYRFSG